MKKIKVFVASSEEMKEERLEVGMLFHALNKVYETYDIILEPVLWELLDSSMGKIAKQKQYNEELQLCDVCIAMYYRLLGDYTREEMDIAYNRTKSGEKPHKLYVFFRDCEDITPELKAFRDSFIDLYGHFYCRYSHVDTLKLQFVLQMEMYLGQVIGKKMNVLDMDGTVAKVGNMKLAHTQNIEFIENNQDYRKLKKICQKQEKIVSLSPDDAEELQELEKAKEELDRMRSSLMDTARIIFSAQMDRSTDRFVKASELFMKGDNRGALAILDQNEMGSDLSVRVNLVKDSKERIQAEQKLLEEERQMLKASIDEYRLLISTMQNVSNISLEDNASVLRVYSELLEKIRDNREDIDWYTLNEECISFLIKTVPPLKAMLSLENEGSRPLTDTSWATMLRILKTMSQMDEAFLAHYGCALQLMAKRLKHFGDYDQAKELDRKAEEILENLDIKDVPDELKCPKTEFPPSVRKLTNSMIFNNPISSELLRQAERDYQLYKVANNLEVQDYGICLSSMAINLGNLLRSRGDYLKSVPYLEEALGLKLKFGKAYDIVDCYIDLMRSYFLVKEYDKFLECFDDAEKVYNSASEEDRSYLDNNMSILYLLVVELYKNGNFVSEVKDGYAKAVQFGERYYKSQANSFYLINALEQYADWLYSEDLDQEAVQVYLQLIEYETKETSSPRESTREYYAKKLIDHNFRLGNTLYILDRDKEAINALVNSIKFAESLLEKDKSTFVDLFYSLELLVRVLSGLEMVKETINMAEYALEAMENYPNGDYNPVTIARLRYFYAFAMLVDDYSTEEALNQIHLALDLLQTHPQNEKTLNWIEKLRKLEESCQ